ncbi:hypothetical protein [Nocardioides massiliensis]|uniref:Transposase-like protein n=1 Tax=Nocardioides massiliensis TaxID=1325935 RepID=A0ABT9NKL2_9ACTN|nr:hypothetical protein [Nocardioides massiliensis]MDP9820385.1 transposase-like protein [Nocardioides massiliensis]
MSAAKRSRPNPAELRELYVDQGLSAAAIGARYGVEKITALRWLRAAGVERRFAGRGLAHRGVAAPSADDLRRLIHEENIGLIGVAEKYGVDYTAVGHWLDRHGIERPTIWQTRRRGQVVVEPTEAELRDGITRGETITAIAEQFGVSRRLIRDRCVRYGIEVGRDGWHGGRRFTCVDGHLARSTYEQRVDDWLTEHGLDHEVEPAYPWDRRYRADFLVGSTYIEVWGVTNNPAYAARKAMKIERCAQEGLTLIQVNHGQFANGRRWWKPLEVLSS